MLNYFKSNPVGNQHSAPENHVSSVGNVAAISPLGIDRFVSVLVTTFVYGLAVFVAWTPLSLAFLGIEGIATAVVAAYLLANLSLADGRPRLTHWFYAVYMSLAISILGDWLGRNWNILGSVLIAIPGGYLCSVHFCTLRPVSRFYPILRLCYVILLASSAAWLWGEVLTLFVALEV